MTVTSQKWPLSPRVARLSPVARPAAAQMTRIPGLIHLFRQTRLCFMAGSTKNWKENDSPNFPRGVFKQLTHKNLHCILCASTTWLTPSIYFSIIWINICHTTRKSHFVIASQADSWLWNSLKHPGKAVLHTSVLCISIAAFLSDRSHVHFQCFFSKIYHSTMINLYRTIFWSKQIKSIAKLISSHMIRVW